VAVVSNSSPLILYARIGRLDLLREVFSEVIIPTAVHEEIVTQGAGRPGAAELAVASWITWLPLANQAIAESLLLELDQDEAESEAAYREVLTLASEAPVEI